MIRLYKKLLVLIIVMPITLLANESLLVPVIIDGETIKLEIQVFKPSGNGPFPTLIFNHGSTGTGKEPELFRQSWQFKSLRRYFLLKEYAVVRIYRRGRGQSEGLYDEGFALKRTEGYSCDPMLSIPGADRGLQDMKAAMDVIEKMSFVDSDRMLMSGWSRGGILSVIYAGRYPNQVKGVINFVGGWLNAYLCETATEVHKALFEQGATYPYETLWLYGDYDPYYSLEHSRKNFKAFKHAGGKGDFHKYQPLPASSGHEIIFFDGIWENEIEEYLDSRF